ncbi:hypothetical protein [Rufibacter aurantiacus]|uniref:hypothetical protein n=1 Tax=Rufibacter aurantiacus TaxID=2817374 RepID=UPI001B30B6D5|nr:hypothetical protein [Rufibacter aurantiacus]
MQRTSIEKSQQELHSLTLLLRERLQSGRNLVYYASGREVRDAYFALPFDHVVLVDYCFQKTFNIKKNVITIGLTALQATAVFKEAGIRFDAFVCINEGLWEGGGSYPINGNWSMGTILPVLKEKYLHISCPKYYGHRRWKKMFNLPHQAVLLDDKAEGYINPTVFSDYHHNGNGFCVWQVTKQPGSPASFLAGNRKVTVQRKNIWDDYDVLNSLLVRCSPHEARNLQKVAPKASPLMKTDSNEQILSYCTLHRIEKLGLTPWRGGQYNSFINFLKANETRFPYPKEVYFYHLHQNDFKQLYEFAGVRTELDTELEEELVELSLPETNQEAEGNVFSDSAKTKILYLHGYGGSLIPSKREILEQYGEVISPPIAYLEKKYFCRLLELAKSADIIIGSSFGGHTGHLLSWLFDKPALLFNPAFVTSTPRPDLSGIIFPSFKNSKTCIVLGKKDDVIVYRDNLEYINRRVEQQGMSLISIEEMGHRISEDVFAEQVATFMEVKPGP